LTEETPPALELCDVSKVFHMQSGFVEVLEGVNFSLEHGGFACILGPSGCGKTTLLKIVAGFISPSHGTVEAYGGRIIKPGPERCFVFQEDALFPWLTIYENIAFGLRGRMHRNILGSEVQRYLELMGLEDFGDYLPREVSGGMKQRASLARVLVLKPKILLMDEPFGSLDAQTREEMQELLLSLWQELGQTILFVTHDIIEAQILAERVLLMCRRPGRIIEELEVPLERPREKDSPAFNEFYRTLRESLRGQNRK